MDLFVPRPPEPQHSDGPPPEDSVGTWALLTSLSGRINRVDFLVGHLFLVFVATIGDLCVDWLWHQPILAMPLAIALALVGMWVAFALAVKRLGDVGLPRFLALLYVAPVPVRGLASLSELFATVWQVAGTYLWVGGLLLFLILLSWPSHSVEHTE